MQVLETEVRDVPLKQLVLDHRCQMRLEISWVAVQEYADEMDAGEEFPPVVVFWKPGGKHFVADGFHRVHAAKKLNLKSIRCEVRHGGLRDAMLHAAGSNLRHGVRRTNADKRKAIMVFLKDREWQKWASAEIARRCGVSANLVERVRETIDAPERQYRLHFNGRGELQYRKVESKDERASRGANPLRAGEKCPYCGRPIMKG